MKKHIHKITLILCVTTSFFGCKKDAFTHIDLYGRVVNYMTKSPLQATIGLSNGESASGNKGNTSFGSYKTNADGSFNIKSHGGWSSSRYWLDIADGTSDGHVSLSYQVKNKQSIDVGDVLMGNYTFYCKITLNPIDNSPIDFQAGAGSASHFNAGTATQFMGSATYSSYEYLSVFNKNYQLVYKTGTGTQSVITIPALTTDTLHVTINY